MIQALANALHVVFLVAVPLTIVAFGVTWFLPERPLRETAMWAWPRRSWRPRGGPLLEETVEEVTSQH